jgi:hypothetical protein
MEEEEEEEPESDDDENFYTRGADGYKSLIRHPYAFSCMYWCKYHSTCNCFNSNRKSDCLTFEDLFRIFCAYIFTCSFGKKKKKHVYTMYHVEP